jgi:hypothetical protein
MKRRKLFVPRAVGVTRQKVGRFWQVDLNIGGVNVGVYIGSRFGSWLMVRLLVSAADLRRRLRGAP